jgi:hypothetical protein
MSSVFEAGISLACIVILHNWFKEEHLGTITGIWFSALYAQLFTQDLIYTANPVEYKPFNATGPETW